MIGIRRAGIIVSAIVGVCLWAPPSFGEADRDKLLSDPGVFGTFATFSFGDLWAKQDQATRIGQLVLLKGVVEQHREKIAIDLYLLRGLSDHADLMFRVHASELRDTQQFLLDLQNSAFGKHLKEAGLIHGLTKKANYLPGFPDQMKADLKGPSEPGPKPYAIVIPVRKSADWWALDHDKRAAMMQEHTAAAVPYLKTVKRKLYHSSGLDDLDFIAYFETSKLEDFHSLILSLEKVKEFQYTRRFGHPTLIGAVKSLDEIIESLAQ
ncbi:MAG: chlorite dismutase family protein [Nitrospira sp.]|jgi:chlorite dismutase|nr:chlorite dismutase family protein [Nitrospira sp.]